jgi:hypothetical protein
MWITSSKGNHVGFFFAGQVCTAAWEDCYFVRLINVTELADIFLVGQLGGDVENYV